MVQTLEVTGIAAGRTTAISLGAHLGPRERLVVVSSVRLIKNRFVGWSMHALAAHSHAFSGHALAAHDHGMFAAIASGPNFDTDSGMQLVVGALSISDASGGVPDTDEASGGTPDGAITGVTGGTMGGGNLEGISITAYTVDSLGRYVLAATHPASGHFVSRLPGTAGPRVELGDAIQATDVLEITALLQKNSAGVFYDA